jgi:NAD(P)-dependent dehydrogenase (short-subunit alcohol dehydrogenase family)
MMMHNKVALVTGASGGMGKVIATELARQGAHVVVVVRRREQGEALQHEIAQATGNAEVDFLVADLADQRQIRHLVEEFHLRFNSLDVVVNNAGLHLRHRQLSPDGIEMHFAVNHLAWFLLINLLLDTLKASAPARVVNVSSQSIADARVSTLFGKPQPVALHLDDLQSARHFEPMDAYARSKLAMVMCGYALARRLKDTEVTVNALHPGLVATDIVVDIAPPAMRPFLGLFRPFLLSPEAGAQTAIYLASSPNVVGETGKYFIKQAEVRSPDISYDVQAQEQLWQISAELVGLV